MRYVAISALIFFLPYALGGEFFIITRSKISHGHTVSGSGSPTYDGAQMDIGAISFHDYNCATIMDDAYFVPLGTFGVVDWNKVTSFPICEWGEPVIITELDGDQLSIVTGAHRDLAVCEKAITKVQCKQPSPDSGYDALDEAVVVGEWACNSTALCLKK